MPHGDDRRGLRPAPLHDRRTDRRARARTRSAARRSGRDPAARKIFHPRQPPLLRPPPVEDGWVYMRIENDVYRVDYATRKVLQRVTDQTSANFP